jgi:TrmH family RNA methyltransferase
VDAQLLASASGLGSGTRTLAVYEERWANKPIGPLCVYLHGVSDPGNVGAILRSAEAFGATSVALGPGTADPFGPKAVRASMGAVFTVPVARVDAIEDLPGTKIVLAAHAGVALSEVRRFSPTPRDQNASLGDRGPAELTLLVGAERDGLPAAVTEQAEHVAHIPITTNSLNAAMAATVALYEITRMPPAQP